MTSDVIIDMTARCSANRSLRVCGANLTTGVSILCNGSCGQPMEIVLCDNIITSGDIEVSCDLRNVSLTVQRNTLLDGGVHFYSAVSAGQER